MNKLKKSVLAIAAVAAIASGNANAAFLTDWYLDTNGSAVAGGGMQIQEAIKIAGTALVTNTFSDATNFTFKEAASFSAFGANSPLQFFSNNLFASFTATGSGTVGALGGTLTFAPSANSLSLFNASTNALIGKFDLVSGGAVLNDGSVLPNGDVSLTFKATSLVAGYFFDSMGGNDLSSIVAAPGGLVFGFATTNASLLQGSSAVGGAIASNGAAYAAAFGAAFDPTNAYGQNSLALDNGGQYRFAVPEPTSLALIGLGLLGLAGSRRRKVVAN